MKVTIEIDDQIIKDQFITAFEGGSNYWAVVKQATPRSLLGKSPSENWYEYIMNQSGTMSIWDVDDNDELLGVLTKAKILYGVQLMSENSLEHFNDMITESGDSITADVFFQYCLLGEIVYG